jgi:small subunit ribosomal protein S1
VTTQRPGVIVRHRPAAPAVVEATTATPEAAVTVPAESPAPQPAPVVRFAHVTSTPEKTPARVTVEPAAPQPSASISVPAPVADKLPSAPAQPTPVVSPPAPEPVVGSSSSPAVLSTPTAEPKMSMSSTDSMSAPAQPTTDDFAALFGETQVNLTTYRMGDRVKARVVQVSTQAVFLDLGGKSEGMLDIASVLDKDGNITVQVGDMVEAYVVSFNGGSIRLAKVLSGGDDATTMLQEAASQGIPVEGKVTGVNKGGFTVQVMGKQGFCPLSQIDFEVGEPGSWIDKTVRFKIIRVEEGGRNVVVSATQLIRDERESRAADTIVQITPGAEFEGVVTRVQPFGAFVDIGGIEGLLHVSEISHTRLTSAEEAVSKGDRVRVKVKSFEDSADPKARRLSLSMRALQEDPYSAAIGRFEIGRNYPGTVTRLERFGAFVEVAAGVEGLVHISEMSMGKRVTDPKEVVSPGDKIEVQVLNIDPLKRQIALSIKALQADPWAAAASKFTVGQTVVGTVDTVVEKGVRVSLADGFEAFIPMGQMADGENKGTTNKFRPGSEIQARVIEVNTEKRRITLSRRPDDETGRREFEAYKASESQAGLGTLGDLFKARTSR